MSSASARLRGQRSPDATSTRCGSCPAISPRPHPHRLQPVPGPAGAGDDRRRSSSPRSCIIGLLRFGESEAQQWLAEESEGHRRWLEEWRGGGFPADASGQRIAALAGAGHQGGSRADPRILHAEDRVGADRRGGIARPRPEAGGGRSRAASRRLCPAGSSCSGRSGGPALRRLRRLLPFSRNDEWELSELKELLDQD